MGYLAALIWLPSLLFSVHAGVLVDRYGRRRHAMILADSARFLLLASIPAAYFLDALTLPQLFIVVFGAGCFSALFNVSTTAMFGFLVAPENYVEAQSLLSGGQQVSTLAGPSVAGLMIQAITAPAAIFVDAASFLLSAGFLSGIKAQEPLPERSAVNSILLEGMRFIKNSPTIRSILSATATINLFGSATQALFIIFVTRDLRLSPGILGLFYGTAAFGGIIGSWILSRVSRRLGVGRALLVGSVLYCVPDLLIPLAHGPAILACALLIPQTLVTGVGLVLEYASIGTTFTVAVPAAKRATVRGSFQAISFGMRPAGALIGGILGTQFGVRPALWVGATGTALSFLWILISPVPGFCMPDPALAVESDGLSADHQLSQDDGGASS